MVVVWVVSNPDLNYTVCNLLFIIYLKPFESKKMVEKSETTVIFAKMTHNLYTMDRLKVVDNYVESVDLSIKTTYNELST